MSQHKKNRDPKHPLIIKKNNFGNNSSRNTSSRNTSSRNTSSLVNVFADTAQSTIHAPSNSTHHNAQSTSNASQLNRRRFLQRVGGTAVGAAGLGLAGCGDDDKTLFAQTPSKKPAGKTSPVMVQYNHGVASGDPLADRVILWTRVTPQTAGSFVIPIQWQMATDEQMQNIVASGDAETQPKNDYTVKVDATGLSPNTVYYYRFLVITNEGETVSPVGRTKTLPIDDVSQVKMAVFSCSNYPAGYFHAYADASKRDDIDVAVHLGDYIYEYGREVVTNEGELVPAYASENARDLGREVEPAEEIVGIEDYRRRYAQYRTDPDLQALHAKMPMIAVWDDHELTNDAWQEGAENHQPETEGKWDVRKLAAVTAYHEWMPIRNAVPSEIYRSFDFGNLLSLHMLDTRVIGRDEQLSYVNFIKQNAEGVAYIDVDAFNQASYDENQQLLGLKQSNWLVSAMSASTATWQVLGQQVLMGRMWLPAPVMLNIADSRLGTNLFIYLGLVDKAQNDPASLSDEQKAILAEPSVPYNLDAWDGYGAAREAVLAASKAQNKNLVVLAGDTHNAWASNLTTADGDAVGVEFATSSVSSPGFEDYLPFVESEKLQSIFTTLIEPLHYANTSQRGYMVVTATPEACELQWVFVSDITQQTYSAEVGKTLQVKAGDNQISEV